MHNVSSLSQAQVDKIYASSHIDAYERLEDTEGWLTCSTCGVLPRVWAFDNGRFATCLCFRRYDKHPVQVESILSIFKRTGNTSEHGGIRDVQVAWNRYVETGEPQNRLEKGCW